MIRLNGNDDRIQTTELRMQRFAFLNSVFWIPYSDIFAVDHDIRYR